MSSYIYCLYSTEDGKPRYVGRASDKVSYRYKQHITSALEKESGPLYDWMREVWRQDHDVLVCTLQEAIVPRDLDMFERYWIDQFANLLNVVGNKSGKTDSKVAVQIQVAINDQLRSARNRPT
jgi:hypothetical protein